MDGINLFGLISLVSLVYCLPLSIIVEGAQWGPGYAAAVKAVGSAKILTYLAISGLFYHLYNQVSQAPPFCGQLTVAGFVYGSGTWYCARDFQRWEYHETCGGGHLKHSLLQKSRLCTQCHRLLRCCSGYTSLFIGQRQSGRKQEKERFIGRDCKQSTHTSLPLVFSTSSSFSVTHVSISMFFFSG